MTGLFINICCACEATSTIHQCTFGITGPGCSKLTTSLVNVSLKFQTLIS